MTLRNIPRRPAARIAALTAAVLSATLISACAPLLLGGAMVGGSMVALDRRTSGAQLEDEAIELKGASRVRDVLGDRGRVSVTSYNRLVLVTGEVPTDANRAAVERALTGIDNARSIVNEVAVMPSSSLSTRSNDALLTGKVKASFVDTKDIFANSAKVVTQRGTVFLMGRVTDREAGRLTEVARGVNGVRKVVRLFEIVSEAELAELAAPPFPKPK